MQGCLFAAVALFVVLLIAMIYMTITRPPPGGQPPGVQRPVGVLLPPDLPGLPE